MAYTEVSRQSWFSRIGGAIKGVVIGLILVVIAFPVLFWNEGRAVRRHKTLKEGAGLAETISADTVNPAYNGKLVHVTGHAHTDAVLSDREFAVSQNAIHLKREVEMYQWRENSRTETKTRTGGSQERTTTYTYDQTWSSVLINSDNFKEKDPSRVNPKAMPFESRTWTADTVTLGAFRLPHTMVNRISNFSKLEISSDMPIPETLAERAVIHDSGYYMGANPAAPKVGDVRIRFSAVYPTDISIVAGQTGNTFETYTTPKTGGTISLLQVGTHSSEAMFQAAQAANRMLMWILRLVGFVMFLVGFSMIFAPLKVVADVLPIMGKIVGAGTGMIAFLLSATLSFFVISIAWVFYRPLIGIPLLILAVAFAVLAIKKLMAAKARPPVSEPAQAA